MTSFARALPDADAMAAHRLVSNPSRAFTNGSYRAIQNH
jgi:hypothetical protein